MVLAGIDEAGYGPLLGPLAIGCTAFEIPGDPTSVPCLWKRLGRIISRHRSKSGRKLHINDSKLVYSPSAGLLELERSVLAVIGAVGQIPERLDGLLRLVCPDAVAPLAEHPWYAAPPTERFPTEANPTSLRLMANGLRAELQTTETRCVYLAARLVPERQLNRLFAATRNKSSVLFSQAAIHIDQLLRRFGQRGLVLWCDRQGGREHYGHLLRLMFGDWSLQVVAERDGYCEYCLCQPQATARLIFCEKAEGQSLPVALASMMAKYLREALMGRFNAWWRNACPDLIPTAGYYQDGQRFLQDISAQRVSLGITDEQLVRSR
jgi:hypothetical protein